MAAREHDGSARDEDLALKRFKFLVEFSKFIRNHGFDDSF
jgi:hypothetical protein